MIEMNREIRDKPRYYRIPHSKGPDGVRQFGELVPVYRGDSSRTESERADTIGKVLYDSEKPQMVSRATEISMLDASNS